MATIRLTKEFSFEAAHALNGYDGPCREIHGHSYRLFVTVKGRPSETENDPKYGMVMDFGVLKQIVNQEIVSRLDHALVLRPATPPCAKCWHSNSPTSSKSTINLRAKTCWPTSPGASRPGCPKA